MVRKYLTVTCFIFICTVFSLFSQSEDDSMVISDQQVVYSYEIEKGKVVVKESQSVTYACVKNVQNVPFYRFYTLNSEIKKIKVKGVKSSPPKYETYIRENIFYDDTKICHLELFFQNKSEVATVTYEKKYKEISEFLFIPIVEDHFVRSKTIRIVVPSWMKIDLVNNNFHAGIINSSVTDTKSGNTVYTYQIENQPAYVFEERMPDLLSIYPYIQVIPRESVINNQRTEYFGSFEQMYAWCKDKVDLAENDQDVITRLSAEITQHCATDRAKIEALLSWVQNNIRYVAFEYGIQGFVPDDAQSVVRKKYGDCKGMSNLLKCLLKAEGFDARLVWVNTSESGREWSLPIPTADHMICALYFDDTFHFLDPTVKFMPFGEIAYPIQGKIAMVEDGEQYLLIRTPSFPPSHNLTKLESAYFIENDCLKGASKLVLRGESRGGLSTAIHYSDKQDVDIYLKRYLQGGNPIDTIQSLEINGIEIGANKLELVFKEIRPSSVRSYDGRLYIAPDVFKEFSTMVIDTLKRKNDYAFPYGEKYITEVSFTIPEEYLVEELPSELEIEKDGYRFHIKYSQEENLVTYRKEIEIKSTIIPKALFREWNRDIKALGTAYLKQIILQKNNAQNL